MDSAKEILLLFVRKLGQAISWVGAKTKSFFNSLSEKINQSLDSARGFFDNFPEEFKQAVVEIKKSIDEGISKVGKILSSLKTLLLSATVTAESNFILLMKMVTSLVKAMKMVIGFFKKFTGYENEMKSKTKQRYKSSTTSADSQTLQNLSDLMLGVSRLFGIFNDLLKEPSGEAMFDKFIKHVLPLVFKIIVMFSKIEFG